jgi:hypothetical protein
MMDEDSTKLLVTVAAMKLLLGRLYALYYTKTTLSPDDVKEAHKLAIESWATGTLVKSDDPVLSDVMSDEVLREMEKFLQGVEKDFRAMLK